MMLIKASVYKIDLLAKVLFRNNQTYPISLRNYNKIFRIRKCYHQYKIYLTRFKNRNRETMNT